MKSAPRTCPVCGTSFYRPPSNKDITCSRTCAARHFRDKGETVACVRCGKPFWRTAYAANRGFGTTCSRECHFALRSKMVDCVCQGCGEQFQSAHYQVNVMGGGKFCSRKCQRHARRKLRKRGERNMFTSWQKQEWKAEACERCGSTERLELDHRVPRFAGGTTERSNAQTLCRTCNRKKFWTDDYALYLTLVRQRAEAC